jgi:hypothetical protein
VAMPLNSVRAVLPQAEEPKHAIVVCNKRG